MPCCGGHRRRRCKRARRIPTIVITKLVPEEPRVESKHVQELREGEDDDERLQHPEAPPPVPADVDLLARQPEGQGGNRPGHQRRRGGGGEAVPTPGTDVVHSGELDAAPTTPARMAKTRKQKVAPLPPTPGRLVMPLMKWVEVPAREPDDDDVHDENSAPAAEPPCCDRRPPLMELCYCYLLRLGQMEMEMRLALVEYA
ncbi:hypothetical protein ZWY2020_059310 [Hordeum vulgare]|nr:hypothetical protein ZWY2020_059310 [Hordeum vulgare]